MEQEPVPKVRRAWGENLCIPNYPKRVFCTCQCNIHSTIVIQKSDWCLLLLRLIATIHLWADARQNDNITFTSLKATIREVMSVSSHVNIVLNEKQQGKLPTYSTVLTWILNWELSKGILATCSFRSLTYKTHKCMRFIVMKIEQERSAAYLVFVEGYYADTGNWFVRILLSFQLNQNRQECLRNEIGFVAIVQSISWDAWCHVPICVPETQWGEARALLPTWTYTA